MSVPYPPSLNRRGFTLMEVLIAVLASSFVLIAVNGIFFGAVRLRNKTTQSVEDALPLHRTLSLMRRDLEGIMMPGGTFAGEFQTTPTRTLGSSTNGSDSSSMLASSVTPAGPEFRTSVGAVEEHQPWADVQRVAYYLGQSTNLADRGYDLYRSVARNLLPPAVDIPVSERLLSGVESVVFQFHDGTQWQDTWDSTVDDPKMPLGIRVAITMVANTNSRVRPMPVEMVVPLLLQARTNSVASTDSATGGGGGQP